MKRLFCLLLALCLVASFLGCGKEPTEETQPDTTAKADAPTNQETTAPTQAPPAEPTPEQMVLFQKYDAATKALQKYVETGMVIRYESYSGQDALYYWYRDLVECESILEPQDYQDLMKEFIVLEDVLLSETYQELDFLGKPTDKSGKLASCGYSDKDQLSQRFSSAVVAPFQNSGLLPDMYSGVPVLDVKNMIYRYYDENGRLTHVKNLSPLDGSEKSVGTVSYDEKGNMARIDYMDGDTGKKEAAIFEYDSQNRVIKVTHEYANKDHNTASQHPNNHTYYTYSYDAGGKMTRAEIAEGEYITESGQIYEQQTLRTAVDYTYDEKGELSGAEWYAPTYISSLGSSVLELDGYATHKLTYDRDEKGRIQTIHFTWGDLMDSGLRNPALKDTVKSTPSKPGVDITFQYGTFVVYKPATPLFY